MFKPGLIGSDDTIADDSTRGFLKGFLDQFADLIRVRGPATGGVYHRKGIAASWGVPERQTVMSIRPVKRIIQSKPTMEGAGVKLRRAFGFGDTNEFDPFLLLDDFRNDRPDDYAPAFPGIRIAASRPSPMCSPARSSTATASATRARSAPATCSG